MNDVSLPDAFIDLREGYLDAYNAIARPDRIIPVTRYLLEHWARNLGSIGFWLVAELRQQCAVNAFRRGKEGKPAVKMDWCRVKQSFLAAQISASRDTVNSALNTPPVTHFIVAQKQGRRFSQRAGRSVPLSYRYTIALDDPLTPTHQAALHELLTVQREQLPGLLRELAALETGDLYGTLEQDAQRPPDRWLPAVADVVRNLHGPKITQEIALLCAKLNESITRPDLVVLVPWYFRDKWLPRLGHTAALMILTLRARCYYNAETGVDRNEIEVTWSHLGQQLGKNPRQIRRLRNHPDMPCFYKVLEEAAGRKPAQLLVGMRQIPLVPEDEERYRQLVAQSETFPPDPETGQLDMLTVLEDEPEKLGHFPTHEKPEPSPAFAPFEQPSPPVDSKDSGLSPELRQIPTHGIEKRRHSPTYGTEKPGHFSTLRNEEPRHIPTLERAKLGHFSTQTIIALIDLIAPTGCSSIAPTGTKSAAAETFTTFSSSLSSNEVNDLERELPADWIIALRDAESIPDRVGVLANIIVQSNLGPKSREPDVCALTALLEGVEGRHAAAVALAAVVAHSLQAQGGAGQAAQDLAPDVHTLLDCLGIQEPGRGAILEAEASYADAMAWTLYAATQPGLTRNKAGYVVQRLLSGKPPPLAFSGLATLPLETIELFRRAVRYGGPYRESIPAELERSFRQWERHFPLKERQRDDGRRRRGQEWDPGDRGVKKGDSLEGLLGDVEVVPQDAWAAVCDALEGGVPAGDLAALRRCWVTVDGTLRPRLSLWPPDDDPAAVEALSTHVGAVGAALAAMGIHHELDVEVCLDPAEFFGD